MSLCTETRLGIDRKFLVRALMEKICHTIAQSGSSHQVPNLMRMMRFYRL